MVDVNIARTKAIDQTTTWLDAGVREIDQRFGTGYAKAHPELLAAFVNAAALDQHFIGVHDLSAKLDDLWKSIDDSNH